MSSFVIGRVSKALGTDQGLDDDDDINTPLVSKVDVHTSTHHISFQLRPEPQNPIFKL